MPGPWFEVDDQEEEDFLPYAANTEGNNMRKLQEGESHTAGHIDSPLANDSYILNTGSGWKQSWELDDFMLSC